MTIFNFKFLKFCLIHLCKLINAHEREFSLLKQSIFKGLTLFNHRKGNLFLVNQSYYRILFNSGELDKIL